MPALIPDAATYGTQQAYAQHAYDKAKNNLKNQQLGWLQQYGMTADYNQDTGGFTNQHIDPYNQYGLIQQNRNAEALDLNAAQDNAISRGIGGPGLGNQAASNLKFQHGVQDQNLGTQFTQGMGQFAQGLNDASSTYQQALYQAEADAIQRAIANGDYEQYAGGDGNSGYDPSNYPNIFASGGQKDPFKGFDFQKARNTLDATRKETAKNIAKSKSYNKSKAK